MTDPDFPAPAEGFVLTHFAVVSDQDRSREWYERVLGARTLNPRNPVIMKVANGWSPTSTRHIGSRAKPGRSSSQSRRTGVLRSAATCAIPTDT